MFRWFGGRMISVSLDWIGGGRRGGEGGRDRIGRCGRHGTAILWVPLGVSLQVV